MSDTEQRGDGSQVSDQDQDTLDHNPNVGGQGMVEGTDASTATGGGGSTSTGAGSAGMGEEGADSSGGSEDGG